MPCRDNKDHVAMTGHKKIGKAFQDFPTVSLLYCLNKMKSNADTTTISPEPSFKQAAKAEAIVTYAAATIATAAPY